jgi:ACR3 family arsenite transporter
MAALGILFFKHLFAGLVPSEDASQVIAGLILLGVAPCTAMVFVWSHLTDGDANYTLVQVSVNDLIMVFTFAPLTALLLGVAKIVVPWETLIAAVVIFVVIPLAAGVLTQRALTRDRVEALGKKLKPTSILGLLLTVVLLFGFQAETILARPLLVVLIAIPLLIQSYGIFAIGYGLAKLLKLPFNVAAPAAMIGTSNFFELAVAVAISLFGLTSAAALATVVGVLIEVPVMLSLVAFANRTKGWFRSSEAPDEGLQAP